MLSIRFVWYFEGYVQFFEYSKLNYYSRVNKITFTASVETVLLFFWLEIEISEIIENLPTVKNTIHGNIRLKINKKRKIVQKISASQPRV